MKSQAVTALAADTQAQVPQVPQVPPISMEHVTSWLAHATSCSIRLLLVSHVRERSGRSLHAAAVCVQA